MNRLVVFALLVFVIPGCLWAQKDNRNVMLNAESATVPRVINVGLPDSGNGAIVFVDDMKHGLGLPRSQYHWAGGNAYYPVGTIGLMESVVRFGEFGILVDSQTIYTSPKWSGTFTGTTSSNALIRFDGAVRGPIGKGWYLSGGAYVNLDPTSVNAPSRYYVEQKQIYQAALSKLWNQSSLNLSYRVSFCGDRVDGGYSVAPFIYNGDGSVSAVDGFRLGRDCYMPADENVRWMDLVSGKWKEGDMSKMDNRRTHDLSLIFKYKTLSGWNLKASAHVCYVAPSTWARVQLAGIDDVSSDVGYTFYDGSPFTGKVQNRQTLIYDFWTADAEVLLQAGKEWKHHNLKTGLSSIYSRQWEEASSMMFAHTVEPSPVRLMKNGEGSWNFNRAAMYMDAWKVSSAFFMFHDWRPVEPLLVRSGVRLKPLYNDVISAPKLSGDTKNARVNGFNLQDPSLYELHHFRKGGLDYVVSEHISWRFVKGLSLMVEGFYSMTNKATTYYRNATLPSLKAIGNALVRGGISYEKPWMDITGTVSYITSWNNAAAINVTKQINGQSETIPWVSEYGIGTLGFTLDGNLRYGGFNLHTRVTWQNPTYKNYRNEFEFSDGSITVIDYSGNTVTGISRLMLEVDPSFRWKFLRVWTSIRYYSRQYVSRTNLAYFNGHFETFAGADFTIGENHKITLNVVNLFFQSGAKGNIDIADTIEDAELLKGYSMAGSYIRPFTVDLMYTYSF
ncbi:MAG: hypothetical protein IJQ61_07990 [Bacteroidales bacterium]|nr:hypothetical protein [Bacteroidales bacterium]